MRVFYIILKNDNPFNRRDRNIHNCIKTKFNFLGVVKVSNNIIGFTNYNIDLFRIKIKKITQKYSMLRMENNNNKNESIVGCIHNHIIEDIVRSALK